MVRKLIWTEVALEDMAVSFEYYNTRNGNSIYSNHLFDCFQHVMSLVVDGYLTGRHTDAENVLAISEKGHIIFYSYNETRVEVLSVWNSRQNPKNRPY